MSTIRHEGSGGRKSILYYRIFRPLRGGILVVLPGVLGFSISGCGGGEEKQLREASLISIMCYEKPNVGNFGKGEAWSFGSLARFGVASL